MPAAASRRARAVVCALIAAAMLVLAAVATAPPAHAGDWTVAEITGPPGTRWIEPAAVNIHGVVVGRAYFPGQSDMTPFRWENGVMVQLPTGGASEGRAYDVNDSGVIVGRLGDNGAVWSGTPPALSLTARNISGRYGSAAHGINSNGTIAGSAGSEGTVPNASRATYDNRFPALTTGGGWTRLQMPDVITDRGATIYGGDAMKINDNGLILIGGMNMSGLPRLSSGGIAGPQFDMVAGNQGFNDLGQIAGRSRFSDPNSDPFWARVWDGAQYVDVGRGQPRSRANAINDNGWIVGRAGTQDWQAEYRQLGNAWLWRLDEAPVPLAQLGPAGWSYANATDVNDDGVIVGVGQHGSVEMGFMMTPAGIAHRLSGTVWDTNGAPVAGAQLRIVGAAGQEVAPGLSSGADGRYSATLPRGDYLVTVLPDGRYVPDAGAGCALLGSTCGLRLSRNRVVDFYAIPAIPPPPLPPPPTTPPAGDSARTASRGPAISGPRAGAALTLSRRGAVGIGLGPFAQAVSGTVTLQEARARARGRARAAAKPVVLGRASFRARARRRVVVTIRLSRAAARRVKQRRRLSVVAVVTARDAAGGTTTKSFRVTLRAPRR